MSGEDITSSDWRVELYNYLPHSWEKFFMEVKDDLDNIYQVLDTEQEKYGELVPEPDNFFRAYYLTPLNNIKVVFVGTESHDQGLPFSVDRTQLIPQDVQLMHLELVDTIAEYEVPYHGDLTEWSYRGVFLLSMSLSTSPTRKTAYYNNQIRSHPNHTAIWSAVIKKTCETIYTKNKNTVFVLFGKQAQTVRQYLSSKAVVIDAPYPNPKNDTDPFRGCDIFRKVNTKLVELGQTPIDWRIS